MNNAPESLSLESLLQMQLQAPLETARTNVPEGEYWATLASLDLRVIETEKVGKRCILEATWSLDCSTPVLEQLNFHQADLRQSIWLDFDSSGNFATGANVNVGLGQLMMACGRNQEGATAGECLGAQAIVKVVHEPDRQDPNITRARVIGCRAAPVESFTDGAAE